MTYQQEILSRAMNHVDDDLIRAAHGPRKKLRHAVPVIVALCLVAALAAAFPYLREVIDTDSDLLGPTDESLPQGNASGSPEEAPANPLNRPAALGGTTATLVNVTDTTATFEVVKTDDTPLFALLCGRRNDALASTEEGYTDNGAVIRHGTLKLYVNGADIPVFAFPSAAGTYRVTVDFTSIRNGPYPMQEQIRLYAYLGEEEKTRQTILFSLEIPEETDTDSESEASPAS